MAQLEKKNHYWLGKFNCMASPCEVFVSTNDKSEAQQIINIAEVEARRIEKKFSRYAKDNIVYRINNSNGNILTVDEETALLLDYAEQCHQLSEGLFDITSGILRKAWRFDGSDNIPTQQDVTDILQYIGWHKITWKKPYLTLHPGMEIDFGGIGKEYAVDRAAGLIKEKHLDFTLINFGGDMATVGSNNMNKPWEIGLQDPNNTDSSLIAKIELSHGAVATSGDAHRFLLKNGKRYSHILNPQTGWPIENAPKQVTVMAPTCIEAGMLATFAMLQGPEAEIFLAAQDVEYRVIF